MRSPGRRQVSRTRFLMEEDFRFLLGLADRSRDGMSLSGVLVLDFLPVLIAFMILVL